MKKFERPVQKALIGARQKKIEPKNKEWKHIELKQAFTPVLRRIRMQHMLKYMSVGLQFAMSAALLLSGLSFLMPVEDLWLVCLVSGLIIIALSLAAGWIMRPSLYKCARIADKMGLQEKIVTACELDERDDTIARLQREDAIKSLNAFDKRCIKLNIRKSYGYALILLAIAVVLVNLIPNPMDRIVQEKKAIRAEIKEQLEELKETEKKLAEQDALSYEQQQELAKLVEELADKLKSTDDYKQAIKEISKAEEELSALANKIREESLGGLAEQLNSLEETQVLAKALSDRDPAALENELKQLKEQLEQAANKEELAEKLREALEKSAESMADSEIKNNLTAAANKLSSSQTGDAVSQLGEAMKQAVNASNAMGEARYALQQMRSSIAKAAGRTEYVQGQGNSNVQNSGGVSQNNGSGNENSGQGGNGGQNGQNGQNSQNNQNGQSGQGTGEGQGSGTGQSGEGQGQQGSGQGNQGNGGQSGSGVGSGTTNQSSGQGGSGTTGSLNGNNQMGNENTQTVYERIYAPERLGDGGEITYVPGNPAGEGNVTVEEGERGAGDLSGFIPYKDVFNEYRNEAMNSMDRRVLPPNIQAMVREYFDALGQ
ncbi:MAG TPA: hypothetical protein GX505_13845 [Clostridiales bacterium]|nr:hypothetical protein [Clostridiales bacterium]